MCVSDERIEHRRIGFQRVSRGSCHGCTVQHRVDHQPESRHVMVVVAAMVSGGMLGRSQTVAAVPRAQGGGRNSEVGGNGRH